MALPTETELLEMVFRILFSVLLLTLIVLLAYWQKVNLEKAFIWSFSRGFVQILLMASILIFIFELRDIIILYGVLLFMCIFAAYTAKNRFPYPNIFRLELIAITTASIFVMVIVTTPILTIDSTPISIIERQGTYIIPMGGMVIANVMVMTTIVLERLIADIKKSRGAIEAALSLGDSAWNSVKPILKDSFRAGLLPTTNRVAVLGIVTIPGLMSGMIIGGVNPVIAAIYQVIIFLMILSAGFIGEILIGFLFVKELFTPEDQLKISWLND
ncbi:MAG: ABC transporter permease [Candidatus Heimdallarchaeota archaeon]|nr:MAG: ABC transporter permease [Candidatus Heimdallarchaeota archaeon]